MPIGVQPWRRATHPLSFLRKSLRKQRYISAADLRRSRNGQKVKLAGLVLVRQRPGSAKGVCFIPDFSRGVFEALDLRVIGLI